MAILQAPKSQSRILIEGLPPKGTYVATCIDVEDHYGVQRPKFDDPMTMETVDLTSFYFGFKLKSGEPFVIRSKQFKISLHEKSGLTAFIKAWTGKAPTAGFDTESLIGQGAQLSVMQETSSKGRIFANIGAIAPVMDGLEDKVVPVQFYAKLLAPKSAPVTQQTAAATLVDDDQINF